MCYLVEGEHLVAEAIASGRCRMLVADAPLASFPGPLLELAKPLLMQLSDLETPASLFAVCNIIPPRPLTDRLLLLDGIQDPGNLGTILRSARAFGFTTVIAEKTVDFYNPKVIRSTQGAIFKLNLITAELVSFMKDNPEYWYYGSSVSAGTPLAEIGTSRPKSALILGNEGGGVRQELLDRANEIITIAMRETESLNVAVAGSIIMHQLAEASQQD